MGTALGCTGLVLWRVGAQLVWALMICSLSGSWHWPVGRPGRQDVGYGNCGLIGKGGDSRLWSRDWRFQTLVWYIYIWLRGSPKWPACCEVHPAPWVLLVFGKNQMGESPSSTTATATATTAMTTTTTANTTTTATTPTATTVSTSHSYCFYYYNYRNHHKYNSTQPLNRPPQRPARLQQRQAKSPMPPKRPLPQQPHPQGQLPTTTATATTTSPPHLPNKYNSPYNNYSH